MFQPLHDDEERTYINSLLDLSEINKYSEIRKVYKVSVADWSDAVIGWKVGTPALKAQSAPTTIKKRKSVERSYTEIHYGNSSTSQGDEYWSNSSASADYKAAVRCISDDFETYPIPPWKSNTEPGTYRYIPDNGSYRTLKFMYDDRKEWYTIRKRYPEKVCTAFHQNCKRMQREMRRQIKKDLKELSLEREKSPVSISSSKLSVENQNSGEETSHSTVDKPNVDVNKNQVKINDKINAHLNEYFSTPEKALKSEPIPRPMYKTREPRVKSTHSDGAVNQVKKMKTIHESEPVTPVPQYSIPTGGQMFKSASDLFIENFSSRISALEDEIKKDSKLLRKNESDIQKIQTSRSKHREQLRNGLKENNFTGNGTPRIPAKSEALTSDIFSVKSVGQKDLKPLEKTRGYLKNNINSVGDFAPPNILHYSSPKPLNHNYAFQPNSGSELDKTSTNSKPSIENTKQALLNTLTGTRINTNNHKKTSKGFSTPATITLCDNTPTNSETLLQSEHTYDAFRNVPLVLDRKNERKGSIQSVPAILPEISGKRLEVTSVSHRLL